MPPAGKTWITVDVDLFNAGGKLRARDGVTRAELTTAYLALIAYSRRRLTDGKVTDEDAVDVVSLALDIPLQSAESVLRVMKECRVIARRKGSWIIPDYAEWQQTREAVSAVSERQSRNARKRWSSDASGNASGNASGMPLASRGEDIKKNRNRKPVETRSERASESTVPESRNGEPRPELPASLQRILRSDIAAELKPGQIELVTRAWTANDQELRHSLADVERAERPAAMLVSIASRLDTTPTPSLGRTPHHDTDYGPRPDDVPPPWIAGNTDDPDDTPI